MVRGCGFEEPTGCNALKWDISIALDERDPNPGLAAGSCYRASIFVRRKYLPSAESGVQRVNPC
jgi:hypothetical protein